MSRIRPLLVVAALPRGFVPLDIAYLAQDNIQELGEDFGAACPAGILRDLDRSKGGGPWRPAAAKHGTVSMRYARQRAQHRRHPRFAVLRRRLKTGKETANTGTYKAAPRRVYVRA